MPAPRRLVITCILDFMCPWSYIGLRSLDIARSKLLLSVPSPPPPALAAAAAAAAPTTATAAATHHVSAVDVSFIPFEFDPPGTYPPDGQDWTEYCQSYGPRKAQFLLQQKLPRAFEIGAAVGIRFSMQRRIVGTEAVNSALELAQAHGKGLEFALEMLRLHFEELRDPNDPGLIKGVLAGLGVPTAGLPPAGTERARRNADMTARARRANPGGGVPKFFVHCLANSSVTGGSGGGEARRRELEVAIDGAGADDDLCEAAAAAAGVPGDGPTSPLYFERCFMLCAASARGTSR
jgi:predicted DsbA family dithiol-disulfide isomerase